MAAPWTLGAVLLTAVVLAGCAAPNDDGTTQLTGDASAGWTMPMANATSPTDASAGPPASATVRVVDNVYEPAGVNVPVGGTIDFVNEGQAMHTVTLLKEGAESEYADKELQPNEVTRVVFTEAGVYQLRCRYHSMDYDNGPQVGRITVA